VAGSEKPSLKNLSCGRWILPSGMGNMYQAAHAAATGIVEKGTFAAAAAVDFYKRPDLLGRTRSVASASTDDKCPDLFAGPQMARPFASERQLRAPYQPGPTAQVIDASIPQAL